MCVVCVRARVKIRRACRSYLCTEEKEEEEAEEEEEEEGEQSWHKERRASREGRLADGTSWGQQRGPSILLTSGPGCCTGSIDQEETAEVCRLFISMCCVVLACVHVHVYACVHWEGVGQRAREPPPPPLSSCMLCNLQLPKQRNYPRCKHLTQLTLVLFSFSAGILNTTHPLKGDISSHILFRFFFNIELNWRKAFHYWFLID